MSLLKSGFALGGRIDRALHEKVEPSFPFGTDEYWMEQALLISMNSCGLSPPNPSVGCVLVKNQTLLASGFTQATGREHAERMAFKMLPENPDLREVTAYVTLEPCSHFGSQPPCSDLFLNTKLKKMVIACQDPDSRVNGEGIARLRANGIEVVVGVLEKEVEAFLFPFFFDRLKKQPAWIGKWAQTPSGYLADALGQSKWISNAESRAYTHWLRQKYDVIVVGAETYLRDLPKLSVRDAAPPHHRAPIPVIFDPRGKLLGQSLPGHFLHFVGEARMSKGQVPDSQISIIPQYDSSESLFRNFKKALNQRRFAQPLQSVMVEGGASLLNGLFEFGLLDAAHQFTGPREFTASDERYRMKWKASESWEQVTQCNFSEDSLQEWRKRF
jgi:diaminohydroxyphosphoribosylaminopyrimidine deaminase/5-amino-6-(5-phosphoribosylamino)uracil reductase